ncbi:MAG: hypothetical protein KAH62_01110 [Desulfobacula sp.]|nr:hypothetical protein [Desulfobacula sp.]
MILFHLLYKKLEYYHDNFISTYSELENECNQVANALADIDVKNDDNIKAVVLTGGGNHFSARGDVKGDIDPLRHMTTDEFKVYFKPINQLYVDLYNLNKPTIAATRTEDHKEYKDEI